MEPKRIQTMNDSLAARYHEVESPRKALELSVRTKSELIPAPNSSTNRIIVKVNMMKGKVPKKMIILDE